MTDSLRPRHLVTVWNPSYSTSAMDAHLEVLLRWARKRAAGEAGEDDVYVWWAKLKSQNRYQPLPHHDDIAALAEQVSREETHIYLTDYRSLYVADVGDIDGGDLTEFPDELEHMPGYYIGREADFWFRLDDIRLIVADDTVATIEQLQKLRNIRYHDRPVSLYGGMVELPLIVTRDDGVRWFADRAVLHDGRLWAEHDAELRGSVEQISRELRENLFGERIWGELEPGTRTFLASADAVFRARRDDPGFDFTGPAIAYAKAVETEVNAVLFPRIRKAMRGVPAVEREVQVDGRRFDLGAALPHLSLGQISTLLEHSGAARKAVDRAFPSDDAGWVKTGLRDQLAVLAEFRNPKAHSEQARRVEVASVRERVMGIGEEGLMVRLARAKMRG